MTTDRCYRAGIGPPGGLRGAAPPGGSAVRPDGRRGAARGAPEGATRSSADGANPPATAPRTADEVAAQLARGARPPRSRASIWLPVRSPRTGLAGRSAPFRSERRGDGLLLGHTSAVSRHDDLLLKRRAAHAEKAKVRARSSLAMLVVGAALALPGSRRRGPASLAGLFRRYARTGRMGPSGQRELRGRRAPPRRRRGLLGPRRPAARHTGQAHVCRALGREARRPAARAAVPYRLRADARAIRSATVIVHGDTASIELPAPLMSGPNRLRWTEMCWMLEG